MNPRRDILYNSFEDNGTKYIENMEDGELIEIDPNGEVWGYGEHIGFIQDENWICFDNGDEGYNW